MGLLKALFGDYSKRELKRIQPICNRVLALEDTYRAMDEATLRAETERLRGRLQAGESTDDILPEAFAACREACDRVLGLRPFPVQILGGIVLHQGRIAEMKTGEGKTLVATLPAYLNALCGDGVHIVTVNDYLARRDSEWMGKVFRYMGLSVGLVLPGTSSEEHKAGYAADITYVTNSELGFDYLRDNMAMHKDNRTGRGHAFAIVDEVDSILIDEARTPLIISGQGDKSTDLYARADSFVRSLRVFRIREMDAKEEQDTVDGDYIVDEKARTATLTQSGVKKAEQAFNVENLMDPENVTLLHHINQAIKARGVMQRDVDYVVKDGQVIIVDTFTGRLQPGRRYSEGLHQAIEAKEGVAVKRESRTIATITYQNFFRLYRKLSGMTGTALTEEAEFREIYRLDVVEIPTNRPVARVDYPDVLYKSELTKFNAVIDQIVECHERQQPVLVGTVSIEKSEQLSKMLRARKIPHEVLNAKHHEKEAEIVAQAGKPGAVTIATNMAGRGTDIKLGGNAEFLAKTEMRRMGIAEELIAESTAYGDTDNAEVLAARTTFRELEQKYREEIRPEEEAVKAAGGLFIIGTERHESRRIDNQLRGRSGRQGDPGASRFYLSMDDEVMRLYTSPSARAMLDRIWVDDIEKMDFKLFSSAVENAQRQVESQHFAARRNVLQYDDVMNRQREIIYAQRNQVLDDEDVQESVKKMIADAITATVAQYTASEDHTEWNLEGLRAYYKGWLADDTSFTYTPQELEDLEPEALCDELIERATALAAAREAEYGSELMREVERVMLLRAVDIHWMDHIDAMDELRRGIGLRAYANQDPVVMYRKESFDMFEDMVNAIREDTARFVLTVRLRSEQPVQRTAVVKETGTSGDGSAPKRTVRKTQAERVGRNDPCPCGSGKKYKQCCGR
ncbi:MAG: preprotein translocase subunit SecA [Clostridia bacterium]|nr:preprotein translocase subunit SecA [Clostridia bacterium]